MGLSKAVVKNRVLILMIALILLVPAVLVSSISTMRLKPKQILSQME